MGHTAKDKSKLLARVRRIKGQIEAVERTLDREHNCAEVLQLITAARGAMNGLMSEVLEDHVHMHVLTSDTNPLSPQGRAAEELIEVVRSYLK